MKNIFKFKSGDFVFADRRGCRLDKELMHSFFSDPDSKVEVFPIPFSFKVLEGMPGCHYTKQDIILRRRHYFHIEVWRDKEKKFLYVIENCKKVYLKFLHEFQRYLWKNHKMIVGDGPFCYDLIDHVNDLYLIPAHRISEGMLIDNEKAYNTKSNHFGFEP